MFACWPVRCWGWRSYFPCCFRMTGQHCSKDWLYWLTLGSSGNTASTRRHRCALNDIHIQREEIWTRTFASIALVTRATPCLSLLSCPNPVCCSTDQRSLFWDAVCSVWIHTRYGSEWSSTTVPCCSPQYRWHRPCCASSRVGGCSSCYLHYSCEFERPVPEGPNPAPQSPLSCMF